MTSKQKEQIAEIYELDAKRTQGEWFFSARTLRSEIKDAEGFIEETPDILNVDNDRCIYPNNGADALIIQRVPDMVSIIRALEAKLENINNIISKPYGTIEKIDPKEKTVSLTYEAWEALLKELDDE